MFCHHKGITEHHRNTHTCLKTHLSFWPGELTVLQIQKAKKKKNKFRFVYCKINPHFPFSSFSHSSMIQQKSAGGYTCIRRIIMTGCGRQWGGWEGLGSRALAITKSVHLKPFAIRREWSGTDKFILRQRWQGHLLVSALRKHLKVKPLCRNDQRCHNSIEHSLEYMNHGSLFKGYILF